MSSRWQYWRMERRHPGSQLTSLSYFHLDGFATIPSILAEDIEREHQC